MYLENHHIVNLKRVFLKHRPHCDLMLFYYNLLVELLNLKFHGEDLHRENMDFSRFVCQIQVSFKKSELKNSKPGLTLTHKISNLLG